MKHDFGVDGVRRDADFSHKKLKKRKGRVWESGICGYSTPPPFDILGLSFLADERGGGGDLLQHKQLGVFGGLRLCGIDGRGDLCAGCGLDICRLEASHRALDK